ncbi:hypothetical protein BIV57_00750 [Mangrovactinospora gilvigrisea]|uniref:Chitin-binding type-2 domain-containing protein n=1 Tax=Mangrovactinospora gilvigrisea TaxID=1428644 RepID=A0A1J7BL21_9ACTN|nr:carbohydrate-binding module family 14 protein [Mangrovactinospora gilvigrisea]OIV39403.1 hypothetical protein BIV57_00750 [Mangrovactinospora gilvigrisea]
MIIKRVRATAALLSLLMAPATAHAAVPAAPPSAAPAFACPAPDGMFTDPQDPSGFYQCSNNIAYRKQCPANLEWSQAEQRCEWPIIANADSALQG